MFGNLTTEGLEKNEDRLGGAPSFPTNIYTGIIKQFYGIVAKSEAKGVELIVEIDGKEYRETLYVTGGKDKGGTNFWTDKNGKKHQLPGFAVVNDICLATVGKELKDMAFEDREVKVYNFEEKREERKAVPTAIDLIGETISLAIIETKENKQKKGDDGKYYDVAGETRLVNHIDKVFNTESRKTVTEALGDKEAEFWDKWLEKNKDVQRDKTTASSGNGGSAGGPPKRTNAAPSEPAKSGNALFGKKG